ncbi:MAG: TonB-dependent receptor plug domain-containing protein [Marinifilaceae bacterium]|jgi:iron complex outermembrane receptor protein|nr:TonB-dependent receptor plug domain-containing protein [Marinifilaceae bacterium]
MIVRLFLIIGFCTSLSTGIIAQNTDSSQMKDTVSLKNVNIWAKKKIQDTGVSKTKIDTTVLRESVSNSLSQLLSQNTTIFIKSYGKGSLATASFRGTAPSHTQVSWNGMKLNSPMLGMVDFSLIPSYFIDDMNVWHGASSIQMAEGALGGGISLNNNPTNDNYKVNFVGELANFGTYCTYLKYNYGNKIKCSTRIYHNYSENDFKYKNFGQAAESLEYGEHPTSKNINGQYSNTQFLHEMYYRAKKDNLFSLIIWGYYVDRNLPKLSVSLNEDPSSMKNKQFDKNLRSVFSWKKYGEKFNNTARLGTAWNELDYTLTNKLTQGTNTAINSESKIFNTYLNDEFNYYFSKDFMLTAKLDYNLYSVDSYEEIKNTGYKRYRHEISPFLALRYKAFNRWGLSYNIRKPISNDYSSPIVQALLTDLLLIPKYNLYLKASIAKNYHNPTLNDKYFVPGGNPNLISEDGYTYDYGAEFAINKQSFSLQGELTYYKSDIENWILWLPTFKSYWTPINVKKVKADGIEAKIKINAQLTKNWSLYLNANYAINNSKNLGDPISEGDQSIGKQLVYVPKYSSGIFGKISYKTLSFDYKYNYYSERFTTSSNDPGDLHQLSSYYMSDISINNKFKNFDIKFSIFNLFDEDYVTVLRRPMPQRNFSLSLNLKIK